MLGTQDFGARGPNTVVTTGPWIARDSYVAETAVALDRLAAKIERLERREDVLAKQIADLIEHAQQSTRFQALAESLRNSRDYKLEETTRLAKDLRGRIEAIEGPRTELSALTYRSLNLVDRKLAEITAHGLSDDVLMRRLRQAGMLAVVSWIGLAAMVALRFL